MKNATDLVERRLKYIERQMTLDKGDRGSAVAVLTGFVAVGLSCAAFALDAVAADAVGRFTARWGAAA